MEKWESKGYNMIEKKNNKLMVISMSGGLDSSTLAARALAEGYLVLPVNFYYGQVNEVEIQAQRTIVNQLKMVYGYDKVLNSVHINLSYSLGDAIHNWQKNRDIGKYNDDLALEYYMPSRNLLFMSLATVLGEIVAKDMPEVNELLLGLGIHKHSDVYARDYWDITPEFASRLQSLLSLNDAIKVSLYAPYANGYKKDIVLDSIKYGVRYDSTWTCYSPNKEIVTHEEVSLSNGSRIEVINGINHIPCNECEACKERATQAIGTPLEGKINDYKLLVHVFNETITPE